jgi:HD superfamily phosphohydrolase
LAMAKQFHEIRDPIHTFIKFSETEKKVIASRPVQRLRNIHQLALTCFLYPGATHKRFEHSLGVMELAGKVFDVLTDDDNLRDPIRDSLQEIRDKTRKPWWKEHLRIAALCHDLGHLPFSHASEGLLTDGKDHETLTRNIIQSSEMRKLWREINIDEEVITKLAIREKSGMELSIWEWILSEIIVSDAFGVDRMDYLLRDSYYTGSINGQFDHYRLIDTMRILYPPPIPDETESSTVPVVGIEIGGIHSAEALMIARYFMYSQVYYHHIRRIYNIHLKEFEQAFLPEGRFPSDYESFIKHSDPEITSALYSCAFDSNNSLSSLARRIVNREHYRLLWRPTAEDITNRDQVQAVFAAVEKEFGQERVRTDEMTLDPGETNFPVMVDENEPTRSSLSVSRTLPNLVPTKIQYLFIHPDDLAKARRWMRNKRDAILKPGGEANVK